MLTATERARCRQSCPRVREPSRTPQVTRIEQTWELPANPTGVAWRGEEVAVTCANRTVLVLDSAGEKVRRPLPERWLPRGL